MFAPHGVNAPIRREGLKRRGFIGGGGRRQGRGSLGRGGTLTFGCGGGKNFSFAERRGRTFPKKRGGVGTSSAVVIKNKAFEQFT